MNCVVPSQRDIPPDTEEIERLYIRLIDGATAGKRGRMFAFLFPEDPETPVHRR